MHATTHFTPEMNGIVLALVAAFVLLPLFGFLMSKAPWADKSLEEVMADADRLAGK